VTKSVPASFVALDSRQQAALDSPLKLVSSDKRNKQERMEERKKERKKERGGYMTKSES